MNLDSANPSYLTDGSSTVLTPRFSSTSQEITYMVLRPEGSSIYLLNLDTTRRESLGDFKGDMSAPRFSPDGAKVAFSVSRGGNSDIFVDGPAATASTARLTADPGIDTSPSFAPDGSRIVFNSDRSGSPQLYVMGADGSNPRRISFTQGQRRPAPAGARTDEFALPGKQTGGEFHIGVMKPDGTDERLLTSSFLDEGPTWAPTWPAC